MPDEKDLVRLDGGGKVVRSRYDKLVEDVVAEKVAREEGLDPEHSARVVVGKDSDGDPAVHVFGRSRDAVDAVADSVRSPRMSVFRRYIGHNVDPEEEKKVVGPALRELMESLPVPLQDSLPEFLGKLAALPIKAGEAVQEAFKDLAEGLGPFNKEEGGKGSGGTE